VLRDLGKSELDLEVESEKMSLDGIRAQNRHIEEYVMRLVRQRDELKNMMKMAEERDSYFILGLEGPEATEAAVKKAYRDLARKEHPDKAGIGNKRRFQAIQQAYTSIIRQKSNGGALGKASGEEGSEKNAAGGKSDPVSASVMEALEQAQQAQAAADRVAKCAHQAIRSNEDCAELQCAPKRKALRAMRDLTKRSIEELRGASEHLRSLGGSACSIARCAELAFCDQKDAADKTVAGVGLRDRAVIVDDAGRSSLTSAELLEKISEATEATLRKVEKADSAGSAGGAGNNEAANLLRLGVRLLSESLTRTAAVARRSADEALTAAIKAHELGRGLAAVDVEARKEREKAAEKKNSFDGEDEVIVQEDLEKPADESGASPEGVGIDAAAAAAAAKTPRGQDAAAGPTSPRDQLKSAAKRVKERHVSLRVKNLQFLATLNEESLKLQTRLRKVLERSEGALLPEVSIVQKKQVFDLVAQLLKFALAEFTRLVASPNMVATPPAKVLERVLSFAIALEHSKEVAMPAESKTQALKLAALLDADLLCQIISGPFCSRLLAIALRKSGPPQASAITQHGRLKVRSMSSDINGKAAQAWTDAIASCSARIVNSVKALNTSCGDRDAPLAS